MTRWKKEGTDRGTGTGMDMNLVFKYMCLITYVSLLLRVIDCGDRDKESEIGVLIASVTPKKT